MNEPSADQADRLLRTAESAETRGSVAVRRPTWYPIGLGLSTALALAAFAVPGLTTAGIVIGAILLPLLLDHEARRRTGASPVRAYLEAPTRGTALTYVVGGAVVAATSLTALKLTGASWVVLPGALVLGVWTVVAARRVEQMRSRARETRGSRA